MRSGVLRWPNGEIPYEFKWGAYSKKVSNWLSTEFEFNYIPNVFRLWHEIIFFPFCVIGNSEKYLIRVAMREWEKYTCLRFRKRQRENNYVMFQDNFGWAQKIVYTKHFKCKTRWKSSVIFQRSNFSCNSQLGMVGGGQPLNLDRNGCRYVSC